MDILGVLVSRVNSHFDLDICDYSRKYPRPWAKIIYVNLAHHNTMYEPLDIMMRIGLDRSSFYNKVKQKNALYGRDKEFTAMYDAMSAKVSDIRQMVLDEEERKLEDEAKSQSAVQMQLKRLHKIVVDLDKEKLRRPSARRKRKTQMTKIIDILAELETERLNSAT